MKLFLKIWRQNNNKSKGKIVKYEINDISPDMSFLEMLDVLNEKLIHEGNDPVSFDHDCREGICGSCSLFINGRPHGPERGITTCQLHMRKFKDGDTIVIEPFRANAYTQKTKTGSNLVKNKFLDEILMSKIGHTGIYEDTWKSNIANRGSYGINFEKAPKY